MAKEKTESTTTAGSQFDAALIAADAASAGDAIGRAGTRTAELVDAWVAAKNAAAIAAIAADERAPAAARKAARRAVNVLKARGVAMPEKSHVARIGGDGVEGYDAWFVPPDGNGTSIVMIAARWKSGRHRMVHAILREGVGLLEVRSADMSRSQLKSSFDESAKRAGYSPAPVPVDWARARVAAARLDNPKSGAILPLGLDTHADVLGPAPASAPPHPIDAANLPMPERAAALIGAASLHGEPEFASWLPHVQVLQELLIGLGQKLGGGPNAQHEQAKVDSAMGEAIDDATDRFFATPESRDVVASRMKDAAISILARRGQERAALALAVGEAARAAGLVTSPPHENPFLRGFFQKGLAMIAQRSGGQLTIPVAAVEPPPAEPQPTT